MIKQIKILKKIQKAGALMTAAGIVVGFASFGVGMVTTEQAFGENCPSGEIWSNASKKCVKNTYGCEAGQAYDETDGCVTAETRTTPGGASPTSGSVKCSVLPQEICNAAKNKATNGDVTNTGVFKLILFVLNILTAGVGIVAVGAVVYAGILYSSAGDNAAQVQQAKDTIKNTIIGIIAFALMYLILNWLIPGGIFKS